MTLDAADNRADDGLKFHLHLGFHKTASTHIQRLLDHNHQRFRKDGIYIVPHKKLRNRYTRVTETYANQQIGMDFGEPMSDAEFAQMTQHFWDSIPHQKFERLVLSEENVAGHVGQCVFPGLLYRFPKHYMQYFAQALPRNPTQIDVVIRRYDTFFASCYLEYISSTGAHRYIPVAEMMEKVMINTPSWWDVLQLMAQVFGTARINVWLYEDLRKTMPDLLHSTVGVPADRLEKPDEEGRSRASPSKEVHDAFLQVVANKGVEAGLMEWKQLKETIGATKGSAFEPWSDQDAAHLQRLYTQDIQQIAQDPRFNLMGV